MGQTFGTVTTLVLLLACACESACGQGSQPSTTSATNSGPQTSNSQGPTTPVVAAAPRFDVHEWGLLDVSFAAAPPAANGQSALVALSPAQLRGRPPAQFLDDAPAVARKPVIYFHSEGQAPFSATVTVRLGSNDRFVEWFPDGPRVASQGETARVWSATVGATSCSGENPSAEELSRCGAASQDCELVQLGTYKTNDSRCIVHEGREYNNLFYRADINTATLPFGFTYSSNRKLRVENATTADLTGAMIVRRAGTFAIVPQPTAGNSVEVATLRASASDARAALATLLSESGLTAEEIRVFAAAWDNELFGAADAAAPARTPHAPSARRGSIYSPPVAPLSYVLFRLPASAVDSVSRLDISPRPDNVRRFIVVRAQLP